MYFIPALVLAFSCVLQVSFQAVPVPVCPPCPKLPDNCRYVGSNSDPTKCECGLRLCNRPRPNCQIPVCKAPEPGCRYSHELGPDGCPTCGKEICGPKCGPPRPCAPPPPNCRYESGVDSNGCIDHCKSLKCDTEPACDLRRSQCPYLIRPGCTQKYTTDPNGCRVCSVVCDDSRLCKIIRCPQPKPGCTMKESRDENNCKVCKESCNSSPECPVRNCPPRVQRGCRKETSLVNGCSVCQVKCPENCPPFKCPLTCLPEITRDENNCPVCKCKINTRCEYDVCPPPKPGCRMIEFGDRNGCKVCKEICPPRCKPFKCPRIPNGCKIKVVKKGNCRECEVDCSSRRCPIPGLCPRQK